MEELIAEGDKVAVRFTFHGTQKGEMSNTPFGRIAPTGKEVTMTGIIIHRIAGGKIVESWSNADVLGLFRQLGAIPAPAPTAR